MANTGEISLQHIQYLLFRSALKHFRDEGPPGRQDLKGEIQRHLRQRYDPDVIGRGMTGGIGRHVGQAPDRPCRPVPQSAAPACPGRQKSPCRMVAPWIGSIGSRSTASTDAAPRFTATCVHPPGAAPRSSTRAPCWINWNLSSSSSSLNAARDRQPCCFAAVDIGIVELSREPTRRSRAAALRRLD